VVPSQNSQCSAVINRSYDFIMICKLCHCSATVIRQIKFIRFTCREAVRVSTWQCRSLVELSDGDVIYKMLTSKLGEKSVHTAKTIRLFRFCRIFGVRIQYDTDPEGVANWTDFWQSDLATNSVKYRHEPNESQESVSANFWDSGGRRLDWKWKRYV
jgi:hypothetical protein